MLKKLKEYLESEKKDKTILDIIVYGSFVKGKDKPNDIDILVIFLEGNLRQRLENIQKIKAKIKTLEIKIDIKQILLKELFLPEFFARTGILIEGLSIFHGKPFSESLGFKSYSLFWYDLKGLNHTQKVKFNYILAGRNKSKGLIEFLEGTRLANGVVKIPIKNSLEFEDVLRSNNINYNLKDILES